MGAQSKERKGSNFAIWQPWLKEVNALELFTRHGAITCAGFVIRALSKVAEGKGQKLQDVVGQ